MKDITFTVDGTTVRLQAPRAVELQVRGTLDVGGDIAHYVTQAPVVYVPRELPALVEPPAPKKGVTIADTAALITDPGFGKYAHQNPFRDELVRAIRFAVGVWGDVPWESIEDSHWTQLLRRRCEELVAKDCKAVRATEITISRLITAAGWLRDTKRIGRDAAIAPRNWKRDVTTHWKGLKGTLRDPQPHRPRYTLEEFQRILAKTDFDPRLYLLLRLAVGLRPGQVSRARRSDLKLPPIESDEYGTLAVHGAGKKGGTTVDLTRGQRLAVDQALAGDGYLAAIEARYQAKEVSEYVVFPTGYIVGRVGMLRGQQTTLSLSDGADFTKHVSPSWTRKGWRTAEKLAGIEHIEGRSTYGQRRLTVDEGVADGLSPSAIQGLGGWSNSKMPLEVYADAENRTGRREARPVRARMLGESDG